MALHGVEADRHLALHVCGLAGDGAVRCCLVNSVQQASLVSTCQLVVRAGMRGLVQSSLMGQSPSLDAGACEHCMRA
jgi:hypothetical protein